MKPKAPTKHAIMVQDGQRMCVLRSLTKEGASRMCAAAVCAAESGDAELLKAAASYGGQLAFQGYLARTGPLILDANGFAIGRPEPGDLFVGEDAVTKAAPN